MNEIPCPFCSKQLRGRIVLENDTFRAIFDLYPVSPGHLLLIPKRHITSFFDLAKKELEDFYNLFSTVH
jgi:diadenosine tetraphosphate (Ap4A) HIT family hydrolase